MKRWNTFQLAFLCFCSALNVGVGAIVGIVKLPIYLDSIGTIMAAALGGWIYGSVVGVLAVTIAAVVIAPTAPAYAGTAVTIALCASILVNIGFLRTIAMTAIGGLLVGVASAVASAPVTTLIFGGVSLAGADMLTILFKTMGHTLMESVILGGLATDPIDKLVTSLIALAILKTLPRKLYRQFPNGSLFITGRE